jgi:hypothetical protein
MTAVSGIFPPKKMLQSSLFSSSDTPRRVKDWEVTQLPLSRFNRVLERIAGTSIRH